MIRFVKTVPDQLQIIFRNADSGIFHTDKNFIMFFGRLNLNERIVVAEFDGIIQKVVKHLLDLIHVCNHIHLIACEHQFDADHFLPAGTLKGSSHVADNGIDLKICFI